MKPGRNDPCPCGSGKKYKACCQDSGISAAVKIQPLSSELIDERQLLALFQGGQHGRLQTQLNGLIQHHPRSAFLWGLLGVTLQMLGQDGLAASEKATALAPADSEAHGNLGAALHQRGRLDEAETSYRRAMELDAGNVRAALNLGRLLVDRGRLPPAESVFRQALLAVPQAAQAHVGLGDVLARMGRSDEAEACFRKALHYSPESAEAYFCLGNLQRERGALEQAQSSYREALRIFPGFAPAHNNLGNIYLESGAYADARECFQHALRLDPNYADAHSNLARVCLETNHFGEAEASYRQALQIAPLRPDLHGKLGYLLKEMGRTGEAESSYRSQLDLDPDSAQARIALAMLKLPAAPVDSEESRQAPEKFRAALEGLSNWLDADPAHLDSLAKVIHSQQPFYLAYRDGNHVDLLRRYGDIVARCVPPAPAPRYTPGGKVRLLVVCNQVRRHSVWDVVLRGLIANLDRERFEITLYHTGIQEDEETARAKTMVDFWRDRRGFPDFEHLVAAIMADRPDAILYPEIGMDPLSFRLAAHRLAPLQMASWGHPISTGLATIDLYLSGDLLESADAQAHYRERLVRLRGTGCCTTALDIRPEPIEEIESLLREERGTRFVIAQRAFKFDPAHDAIYAEIAAAVGACCFIVLRDPVYPWASARVLARLAQAFRSRGLDPQAHLLEIPWLTPGKFVSLLDTTDVFLDCPAFSGYTTAWQAVHRGLPIVTLAGAFLRQRLAAGLLRKIGWTEGLAQTLDEYVAIAVRLASLCADSGQRANLRATIQTAAPAADGDVAVVRAFEQRVIAELAQTPS